MIEQAGKGFRLNWTEVQSLNDSVENFKFNLFYSSGPIWNVYGFLSIRKVFLLSSDTKLNILFSETAEEIL